MPAHPPFTVEPAGSDRGFYRVLDRDGIDPDHFLSDERAGKEQALEVGENTAIYRGCSVRATYAQAAAFARLLERHKGNPHFVAHVTLNPDEGDCFARTFRRGHHTIWGHPDLLASRATLVDGEAV